jgi:hypothetical protein
MPELYLMLIRVTQEIRESASLAGWITEIHDDYMGRFENLGASVAHVVFEEGPWHFALVFPGSEESVEYLTNQILARSDSTEIQTMRGTDLDTWRAGQA